MRGMVRASSLLGCGPQMHCHAIQFPPRKHRIRVRVVSGRDSYDQSGAVAAEFAKGEEKVLPIHCTKRGAMSFSLKLMFSWSLHSASAKTEGQARCAPSAMMPRRTRTGWLTKKAALE